MKYIGIGNCNKYNIYILTAFLSELLINLLFGLNSSNDKKPVRIFPFKPKIRTHMLLDVFIQFIAIFFGGIFLYIFERRNKSQIKNEITIQDYEKMKEFLLNSKDESITLNLILIGALFSLFIIIMNSIDLKQLTF